MVASDGGGCPAEGYAKRYFGTCTVAEATVIRQAWWEGGSAGSVQRRVMAGDEAVASEMGNSQVSGEPRGETTRDSYAGTETGDDQVGV